LVAARRITALTEAVVGEFSSLFMADAAFQNPYLYQ
jgi:hypothetical protein